MSVKQLEDYDLKRWGEIILMVATIGWVLYLLPTALEWRALADRVFPLLSGVIVIALATIQILRNLSPKVDAIFTAETEDEFAGDEEVAEDPDPLSTQIKTILILLGWVTLFPIMVYYLGFGLGTPLYTFGIFWYYHRDLKYTILLSTGLLFGMYILFIWLLGIQVWEGTLDLPSPLDYL